MSEPAELTLFTARNPIAILTDREEFERFYADIKQTIANFVPDTSTQKGRDAIKALAFKVTKTKTFLDSEGKRLTEEKRHEINLVDASRRHMREQLEALKDEVRAPLDKWEEAEQQRVETINCVMDRLQSAAIISADETAATLGIRFDEIYAIEIGEEFEGHTQMAKELRRVALEAIEAGIKRVEKEHADRAELVRLRAEKEAAERAAAEKLEAELREADRQRQEKAEAERKERVGAEIKAREERLAREAAEAAEREVERKAANEKAALEEKHHAELQREREKREQVERENEARIKLKKEEEDAQIKRDLDKMHRRKVAQAAAAAIKEHGDVTDEQAKKVVLAIIAGEIPNVTLRF